MAMHTVLVVDDEPAGLRAVQRALVDEHPVVTVASGIAALDVLAAQPVALLIADQRMPEMRGTELLARCARQHPDVIRVLLTGYAEIEALIDAINAGQIYHYLTKPWEPQELRLVARRGVERYAAEAERRRLIHALEQAGQQARREAEQKGRLLMVAAHELGTPLHVLSNALALMAEGDLPAPSRRWLDTARRSVDWLGRGLAQMTTAARWRAGRLTLQRRPADLAAVLEDLQATVAPIIAVRRLALQVSTPAGMRPVMVDRIWLGRALFNLLSNAVRFTPDGGSLSVEVAADAHAVHISVADTGIGIDAAVIGQVFEPFSPASGDLSLHASGRFEFGSRGLGLGLAITKAIVEQHEGTITVRSAAGAGSRFTITLPRCTEAGSEG